MGAEGGSSAVCEAPAAPAASRAVACDQRATVAASGAPSIQRKRVTGFMDSIVRIDHARPDLFAWIYGSDSPPGQLDLSQLDLL